MPKAKTETVGYELEMKFEFTETPAHLNNEAEKMKMVAFHQISYARDLFWLISTFSEFAVSSLLVPDTEINEFEFDHIHTFEVFKNVADLGNQLLTNTAFSISQAVWVARGGSKTPIYKGFHDVEFLQSVESFIGDYNRLMSDGQKEVFEAFNNFRSPAKPKKRMTNKRVRPLRTGSTYRFEKEIKLSKELGNPEKKSLAGGKKK